jgi:TM2 domain-containing membrane protein YozV
VIWQHPGRHIRWESRLLVCLRPAVLIFLPTEIDPFILPDKAPPMANVLQLIPDAESDELLYLHTLMQPMTDQQAGMFASIYRARRKEPVMILLLTLVGFLGIAGIQRFVLGQIGLGLLYLFTGGLCFIGIIVDLINYRKMTSEYNQRQAYEVATMMRTMGQL